MKIVDTYYVIMKVGNIGLDEETAYLTFDCNFTNDIKDAAKAVNRIAALSLKHSYDVEKNRCYESDLNIVPLRVTYEW